MEKLKMESIDITQKNIERIGALFPAVITEIRDVNGKLKKGINFELLKQELTNDVVDGEECYDFTWVGKKTAIVEGNTPIRKTLRPCIEESKNWENTGNLYIEGDNLDVLKLLQESYLNSIKMIYIDPPYNTGSDSFIYPDNYKMEKEEYEEQINFKDAEENILFKQNNKANPRFHSDWCSMIYSRLKLAQNLLTNDGVLFVSIDDNEVDNLKKICSEIFGEQNFVAQIVVQANKGGQDYLPLAKTHEYILCYFKSNEANINLLPKNDVSSFKYSDKTGKYELREVRNRNPKFTKANRPNLYYPIYVNPDIKDEYGCCAVSVEKTEKYSIEVYPLNSEGNYSCWRWGKDLAKKNIVIDSPENSNIISKQKRDGGWNVYEKNRKMETKAKTLWDETEVRTERGTIVFRELFNSSYFDHPKPVELVYKAIQLATNPGDIILDFFSGSATTAHAVMQLNAEDGGDRKYIMVQFPEPCSTDSEAYKAGYKNICEIGKERIRRAGEKIYEEIMKKDGRIRIGEEGAKSIDIGFRVLKLESTNMKDVYYAANEYSQSMLAGLESNIKEDRSDLDLLYGVLLDWGLPLSLSHIIEEIDGISVHTVDEGSLVACFAEKVSESIVREITKGQPLRVVFRDSSFANSPDKINVEEIFKLHAPNTTVKVI